MAERSSFEHVIRHGECLASLAAQVRAAVEDIWNLDENAELRERRQDPYVLAPGDRVTLPAQAQRTVQVAAGRRHTFQVNTTYADFQVRVVLNGKPRGNVAYKLLLDGGDRVLEGVTDAEGNVRARIPASVKRGVVEFVDGRSRVAFELGTLEPWDTPRGMQGRLRDLGYYLGKVDGIFGPRTARALRRFQRELGLAITGRSDEATMTAIRAAFGR